MKRESRLMKHEDEMIPGNRMMKNEQSNYAD
jgi:hypothetical protein